MTKFRGLFPAVITPMTPEDELNEAAFRKVLEFNIQAGVHGFWIAGGSGESILISEDENQRIAQIAVDQIRGRVGTIMHVSAPTTAAAVRNAENAARAGVDSICGLPPCFYGTGDDELVEFYRSVGRAADLPLFVYNLPDATGVEVTPELAKKIQDNVPQLVGLKHSALNFKNVWKFSQMGLDCFMGFSSLMLPALTVGAVGSVDGPPNIAPEPFLEIWEAYQAGDWKRAQGAQERAAHIFNLFEGDYGPYIAVLKSLLSKRLGVDCGNPRPPSLPLTEEQANRVWERFCELMPTGAAVGD